MPLLMLLTSTIAFTLPTTSGPLPTQYLAARMTPAACSELAAQVRRERPGAIVSCQPLP